MRNRRNWMWIALALVAVGGWAQERKMPAWLQQVPQHAELEKFVGEWEAEAHWWTVPGKPPLRSKATSSAKSVMNGYFVEQTYVSNMAHGRFEGRMLMGYDTVRKKYLSLWFDSSTPTVGVSYGEKKDDVLRFDGMMPDRMTGKPRATWSLLRWIDDDRWSMTSFVEAPDGSEVRQGQIIYSRKKE